MKKTLALSLATIISLGSFVPAFAASENLTIEEQVLVDDIEITDDIKEEIDETLAAVCTYLNNETISLTQRENKVYNIPVGEKIVTVTVKNEQLQNERNIGLDYYDVVANSSYKYTLTINNLYNGTGKIVFKLNYDTGDAVGTSGITASMYKLTITKATISATAPTNYDLYDSGTFINHDFDGSTAMRTTGYATFRKTFLPQVGFNLLVEGGTAGNDKVQIRYSYEVN